jgi:inosine/xanthosine triphosphate pyrophosphatase family protein
VPALVFIDGNELRAQEIRRILPGVELAVEALQTGFSTSAPEPAHRARDKVLAHPVAAGCFAEAVDLTTLDGKSLRLELDSENENRFCKWWRETPARLHLVVALRRAPGAEIELVTGVCEGRIADQPAGPHVLGWDRLFVPAPDGAVAEGGDGDDGVTLAQLTAAGEIPRFRHAVYAAVGRALAAVEAGEAGEAGEA